MPRGRPRLPGTEAERNEARRLKVRQNVAAFRTRQKSNAATSSEETPPRTDPSSKTSSEGPEADPKGTVVVEAKDTQPHVPPILGGLLTTTSTSNKLKSPPSGATLTLKLWASPTVGSAYRTAFLSALYDRFHPDATASPRPHEATGLERPSDKIPCSSWVSSACSSFGRKECDALSEATLAAALAVIGAERADSTLNLLGIRVYVAALRKLSKALRRVLSRPDALSIDLGPLIMASFSCANVELMTNQSLANMQTHINGVGSLIRRRGQDGFLSPESRMLFYEYRIIENTFCMLVRRSSLLCQDEWINTPWKDAPDHVIDPAQTLMDVSYRIPPLLEGFDESKKNGRFDDMVHLLSPTEAISTAMIEWLIEETSRSDVVKYCAIPVERTNKPAYSKAFCCPFVLLPWGLATALVYWLPYKIQLLDLAISIREEKIRLEADPDKSRSDVQKVAAEKLERLWCARKIRHCLPHFLDQDKKIVGWVIALYPFNTAYFCFLKAHADYMTDTNQENGQINQLDNDLEWCHSLLPQFCKRGLRIGMFEEYGEALT